MPLWAQILMTSDLEVLSIKFQAAGAPERCSTSPCRAGRGVTLRGKKSSLGGPQKTSDCAKIPPPSFLPSFLPSGLSIRGTQSTHVCLSLCHLALLSSCLPSFLPGSRSGGHNPHMSQVVPPRYKHMIRWRDDKVVTHKGEKFIVINKETPEQVPSPLIPPVHLSIPPATLSFLAWFWTA